MTKSWRPEGWRMPLEIKPVGESGPKAFHMIDRFSYEAGADAMLEALKQKGKYIDASKYPYGFVLNQIPPIEKLTRDFKGYVVIIPDEVQVTSPPAI